jgi:hypothetical protein
MGINADHTLRVVKDDAGSKLVRRLYDTYCREEESPATFPAFLIAVDRLLKEHGGKPAEPEPDDKDVTGAHRDKGGAQDDDDYEDDEDVHELGAASDADMIRKAVSKTLNRFK